MHRLTTTTSTVCRRAIKARTARLSRFVTTFRDDALPFFPNEPSEPKISTEIPGPRSREALVDLKTVFDTNNVNMVTNFEKSVGNYICDPDGNLLLDVYAQIASIPVGYNNPTLLQAVQSKAVHSALINRPALGNFPQHDWAQILRRSLLRAAPSGLNKVFTSMSGSDANELAYKAAFMYKARQRRGDEAGFTELEISSVMQNQAPGSPRYSILSFRKGFHGRLFGSLSTTRSKPIHKLDIPAFDWPSAPFPALKYPLEGYIAENKHEEERCLIETERLLFEGRSSIAAMIIEPIQSEGGDNHASPTFFQGLRELATKHKVLLIVDEVQTGVGATGKLWAHEHWQLSSPPDIVTFSKKAQTAGYFYANPDLQPKEAYRQFNTWMGDPARALLFGAIYGEIVKKDLVSNAANVGDYLYSGIKSLQTKYSSEINNLRGKGMGTFIAFDSPRRDDLLRRAKSLGLNVGGSGERAVRLRPMLVFQRYHADLFLERLERLIRE